MPKDDQLIEQERMANYGTFRIPLTIALDTSIQMLKERHLQTASKTLKTFLEQIPFDMNDGVDITLISFNDEPTVEETYSDVSSVINALEHISVNGTKTMFSDMISYTKGRVIRYKNYLNEIGLKSYDPILFIISDLFVSDGAVSVEESLKSLEGYQTFVFTFRSDDPFQNDVRELAGKYSNGVYDVRYLSELSLFECLSRDVRVDGGRS